MSIEWFEYLRVYYHQTGIGNRNYNTENSIQDNYIIMQTLNSSGRITIDTTEHDFLENSLLFYKMSKPNSISPDNINHYVRNKIIVDQKSLDSILSTLDCTQLTEYINCNNVLIVSLDTEDAESLDNSFHTITGATESSQEYQRLCCMCELLEMIKILFSVTLQYQEFETKYTDSCFSSKNKLINEILAYINKNHLGEFSLTEMATSLHYSKEHLCRVFKKEMNISITSFVNLRRLGSAKNLLENTDISIEEIVNLSGFNSTARFYNTFREMEGVTPREYRSMAKDRNIH